jgi:hypothetical protein
MMAKSHRGVLALILSKANAAGHIKGFISHLLPTDDTMIMIEKNDTSI